MMLREKHSNFFFVLFQKKKIARILLAREKKKFKLNYMN